MRVPLPRELFGPLLRPCSARQDDQADSEEARSLDHSSLADGSGTTRRCCCGTREVRRLAQARAKANSRSPPTQSDTEIHTAPREHVEACPTPRRAFP